MLALRYIIIQKLKSVGVLNMELYVRLKSVIVAALHFLRADCCELVGKCTVETYTCIHF